MNNIYIQFESKEQLPIKCDLLLNNSGDKKPLVILLHGFKSFRNWGFNPWISDKLNKKSFNVLNFDFSRNGISDQQKMIYDVELFRKNTVGIELDDIDIILNSLNSIEQLTSKWNGDVYLIGHSMGGAISAITAQKFPIIKKISLWGAISKWNRNSSRQKQEWKEKGYMEFKENSTGQTIFLDYSYLQYKEQNTDKIDIRNSIKNIDIPIQIVHGEQDFTVPAKEGEILYSLALNPKSEIKLIPKTGHTFGVRHPMIEANPALETAINSTIDFFNRD
ncbi:alpha/beta fold hydrolase, partial [Candidatus Kapabacteria bacterium]|nr:alpha/beta fold hydrolase [Candidatus Kapabacteria bacterium]